MPLDSEDDFAIRRIQGFSFWHMIRGATLGVTRTLVSRARQFAGFARSIYDKALRRANADVIATTGIMSGRMGRTLRQVYGRYSPAATVFGVRYLIKGWDSRGRAVQMSVTANVAQGKTLHASNTKALQWAQEYIDANKNSHYPMVGFDKYEIVQLSTGGFDSPHIYVGLGE